MVRRVYRACEFAVLGAVATVAVLAVVVSLRLMSGPVDLEFLRPYLVEQFHTQDGKVRFHADHLYAEWGGLSQPMRLVMSGVHITDEQRQEIAAAPAVALSFEPRSVIRGHLLPTAIVIERPSLEVEITREGGMMRRILAASNSDSQDKVVALFIEQLLAEPNHDSVLGQLDTVLVERARLTIRDVPSGIAWVAPAARARLKRDASGVIVDADARFSDGGQPIEVALSATYARDRSRISAEAKIDGLKPLMFADFSPDIAILRGIDIALSGRLAVEADGSGVVRTVSIDITGGNGTLNLPGILPVAHKVQSVNAHASVDAATHTAKIDRVEIDVGAAKVSFTGHGIKADEGQMFSGRAEVRDIPIDRLGDYWPLEFADGGRNWAVANLSGGSLDVAAEFAVSAPGNDIAETKVTRMVSFLTYRGMKVRYMPHMPELEGVTGTARFEGGTLHFDVAGGSAVGLRMTGATIDLTGLDGPSPQYAALRLPITGLASNVMAFLSRRQLGIPKEALVDPKLIGGDAAVELTLAFPLLNALTVAEIDVKAEAALSGFSRRDVIGSVDLTDASGRVSYGNSQLAVKGQGKLDGSPVEIHWRENFAAKVPFRHRYELKGTLPSALVAKAGFPSPEPYITGPIGATVSYQTQPNGTGEVVGKFDLKGAKASVSPLAWSKEAGTDGQLGLTLKLAPGGKLTTADFDGQANGLQAKGQVRFDGDNVVQQINVHNVALGRSSLSLDWQRVANGIELGVRGRALELARVRQALHARDDSARGHPGGAAETARGNTKLSVQLDQLLAQRGSLGAVNGRLELAGERVTSANVTIGAGKGSAVRITPSANGRSLAVYVPDLGLLLKEAGWLDGFVGGLVDVQGRFDDSKPTPPLTGAIKVGPYRLEQVTPRPGVGTLNEAITGLNRAGNALQQFNGLDAKIDKAGDRIDIKDGRTSGQSIGLTTAGTIDLGNDTARLRGVIVPGFALNNLLSNVPLLGPLLTGGKDGGVFAFSYTLAGPFDDLKTDVNMMSAMTPGALREIFATPPAGSAVPQSAHDVTR